MRFVALLTVCLSAWAFQPDPAVLRNVYQEALARREREYGPADPRTAQACRDIGYYLRGIGDSKSALPFLERVVRIDEANYGPQSRQTLADAAGLASVAPAVQAEALLRRAMQSTDPQIAGPAVASLGDLRLAAGDKAGASGYFRIALSKAESAFGKDGAMVGNILNTLAPTVPAGEGIAMLERALDIAKRGWGDPHPETATTEVNLARLLLKAGRREESAAMARQGLAGFEATMGPQHPRTAAAARALAVASPAEAEALYRRAIAIDRVALGPKDKQTLEDEGALKALQGKKGRAPATAGH